MASLLISDIDEDLYRRLSDRAAANRRPPEQEAREVLIDAVRRWNKPRNEHLVDVAQRIFGVANGVDLDLPDRSGGLERAPPDFSGPEFRRD